MWRLEAALPSFPALAGPLEVDVAIVGAGISGLTAALLLKREGLRVAVLEARSVGAGETGLTTAHLTEMVDARYAYLHSHHGKGTAAKVAAASREAIDLIESLVRELSADCDFQRVPGFLYSENASGASSLKKEQRRAKTAGLDAELTDAVPLPFPVKGALRLERQAQFHPLRYLAALARAVQGEGSLIAEQTRVLEVLDGAPCHVKTERGEVIARAVLVTANVPVNNRVLLHTKLAAYRSYVIAAEVPDLPPPGLYWDTDEPYHYLRTQQTKRGPLLIVGGEDHRTGLENDTEDRYARLERYLRERFPGAKLAHRWSGQIIEPVDGLPFIGLNAASKATYVATGYSGNGMTFGSLAGAILRDAVLGRENPYADLFHPTRARAVASLATYVSENSVFPSRLVADRFQSMRLRSERSPLSHISPGEGKLVELSGKTVAVYRDESGTLHGMSPVCPHLWCHVGWNGAERSWDCPCHGSRFDAMGRLVNGPAVSDLARVSLPGERPVVDVHPWKGEAQMDALQLLKEQHDEVKDYFEQFEEAEEIAEKRELFVKIADALSAHATIEEKIFYPAVKVKQTEDLLKEALEEHLSAKRLIADLLELEASDETFEPKVKVLQEQIEHHVEEEEGDLFKDVRKLFTKEELTTMGEQMEVMFDELMEGEPRNQVPAETDAAPSIS